MNFFERRRYKKLVKHLLHETRHARNMREDVVDSMVLDQLENAKGDLVQAWEIQDADRIDGAAEGLASCIMSMYPSRAFARVRENVEILVVALAVAMGVRTYFVQPFKIPTGSMQPTLNGITYITKSKKDITNAFPINSLKLAVLGRRYFEVKAQASGQIIPASRAFPTKRIFFVNGIPHEIATELVLKFRAGQYVAKGQVLATGEKKIGDHIFVDKIRYNFSPPKRGDIIVFDTSKIDHPDITPNSFYIKRCAGLPGEEISINQPRNSADIAERYLKANGIKVDSPYPFYRLLQDTESGYEGYTFAKANPRKTPYLRRPEDVLKLNEGEYLPLGDNTQHSLDGRYFGAVRQEALVGPAFAVYWPLSKRWGRVR